MEVAGHHPGITLLDTTTGAIVSGYKPPALNGVVYTIASAGGRTYIAGSFTVAGSTARGGIAALVPTTGALDPSVNLSVQFAGHHNYTAAAPTASSARGRWPSTRPAPAQW